MIASIDLPGNHAQVARSAPQRMAGNIAARWLMGTRAGRRSSLLRTSSVIGRVALAVFLLVGSLVANTAAADTDPSTTAADVSAPAEAVERERRRNTAAIGMILLVGVASIGVLLIAGALIWGGKVRRMVRDDPSRPTHQDELWYLRKGTANETGREADLDVGEASPIDDGPHDTDSDDTRT